MRRLQESSRTSRAKRIVINVFVVDLSGMYCFIVLATCFGVRIKEHFEPKSRSPMFFHSLNCEKFRNELEIYLSEPDTPKYKPRTSRGRIRANFCFKRNYISVLSNQPYYRERTLYEAFSIKLTDPCLNKQVKFEETQFL